LHKFLSKLNSYNLKINKVDEFEYKNRKQFIFIKINENKLEILQKKSNRDNFQKDENNPFESDDYKKAKINDRFDFEDDIIGKEVLNKKDQNYDKKKTKKENQEDKGIGKKVKKIRLWIYK
jgi:hypothetical protein